MIVAFKTGKKCVFDAGLKARLKGGALSIFMINELKSETRRASQCLSYEHLKRPLFKYTSIVSRQSPTLFLQLIEIAECDVSQLNHSCKVNRTQTL